MVWENNTHKIARRRLGDLPAERQEAWNMWEHDGSSGEQEDDERKQIGTQRKETPRKSRDSNTFASVVKRQFQEKFIHEKLLLTAFVLILILFCVISL